MSHFLSVYLGLTFHRMNLKLYDMICDTLISSVYPERYSQEDLESFHNFHKKNKIRFYHKKCTTRPFFCLSKDENGDVECYSDGRPILQVHFYDDKTKQETGTCKVLLAKEMIVEKFDEIHRFRTNINGKVLQSCHPMSIKKLVKTFNEKYHYKGINEEAKNYIQQCDTCAENKQLPVTLPPPPVPIRSFEPLERVQFDLIDMAGHRSKHMLDNEWEFRYILSIKDCFSKYCWLFPLSKKKPELIYYAANFVFEKEGYPRIFQSDNGKEFVSDIVTIFMKENNVKIMHGKPYHPQSQGQVENLNKRVKQILSRILQKIDKQSQGKFWPLYLPGVASQINNTWHSTIDDIPFRVYRQRDPSALSHSIVPKDFNWADGDVDSEGESEEPIATTSNDEEHTYDIGEPSEIHITASELFQICSSACLHKDVFGSSKKESTALINVYPETNVMVEGEEFSEKSFNFSLYLLGRKQMELFLPVLESTEYVIHRNIKYRYCIATNEKFLGVFCFSYLFIFYKLFFPKSSRVF